MVLTDQQARWQHLALFAVAVGLLSGGMMFVIPLVSYAPKAKPWWVGAIVLVGSATAGALVWTSLRRDQRRAEFLRLANAGLFRLPDDAGHDIAQLNVDLVEQFGVAPHDEPLPESPTLPYESAAIAAPKQPLPRTFAALVDAVLARVERGATVFPSQHAIARRELATALGRAPESLRYSDLLVCAIPAGGRRFRAWEALRVRACGLPEAALNPWLENIAIYGFLAGLIAIAVPIAQRLDADPQTRIQNPSPFLRVFGHCAGLILFGMMIGVLMIPVHIIGRRYACRLPQHVRRVGSLAAYFPALPTPATTAWTRDDVEAHLRDMLDAVHGRSPGEISDELSIFAPAQ